ncbi:MAG: hypothetical protein Ta2A_13260 [Treponemataceae bacterium]|nr:MAG: hypothetical protein Ta2A_13260 [Treponemataceae bacterium]
MTVFFNKLFVNFLLSAVLVLSIGVVYLQCKLKSGKTKEKKSIISVVNEILPVSEFSCLLYRYRAVNKDADSLKFIRWNLPFTGKRLIYSIEGTIKLGINCREIKVKIEKDRVRVKMPDIKILSHEIMPESVMVYDEKHGAFNHYTAKDHFRIELSHKDAVEADIIGNTDVFLQAKESAEMQFGMLLGNLPGIKGAYTVTFDWTEVPAIPN